MRAYSIKQAIYIISLVVLAACGGPSADPVTTAPANTQDHATIIGAMNKPLQRTPASFYNIGDSNGMERGYLHVSSDQIMAGSTVSYDLSTNDANQAFQWAQQVAQSYNQTMTFAASDETNWYYEYSWTYDPTNQDQDHMLSVRVFKSSAIDRTVFDKYNPGSLLAVLQQTPVSSQDARYISEYLWTFSAHNNTGHIVLSSHSSPATTSGVRHTIREAVYDPSVQLNTCVSVAIRDYHYDINNVNGGVVLSETLVDQFQAKLTSSHGYVACQ